jgi:hypothetical protein
MDEDTSGRATLDEDIAKALAKQARKNKIQEDRLLLA